MDRGPQKNRPRKQMEKGVYGILIMPLEFFICYLLKGG